MGKIYLSKKKIKLHFVKKIMLANQKFVQNRLMYQTKGLRFRYSSVGIISLLLAKKGFKLFVQFSFNKMF